VNSLQKLPLIRADETLVDLSREVVVGVMLIFFATADVELLVVILKSDVDEDDVVVASINLLQLINITINNR
jgi:hypothetical protein